MYNTTVHLSNKAVQSPKSLLTASTSDLRNEFKFLILGLVCVVLYSYEPKTHLGDLVKIQILGRPPNQGPVW